MSSAVVWWICCQLKITGTYKFNLIKIASFKRYIIISWNYFIYFLFFLFLKSYHRIHQMNTNSSASPKLIQDPMTDEQVIMELRRRSRHRGHQIVGYRRKLMQQVKFTPFLCSKVYNNQSMFNYQNRIIIRHINIYFWF